MGAKLANKKQQIDRPEIFGFHDFREFLASWTEYLKGIDETKTLRALSRSAKLSPGYLPLVFAGHRRLSQNSLNKLMPHLQLKPNEQSYLKLLVDLGEAKTHEERAQALKQIQRFNAYKSSNTKELEIYKYLSNWYLVAIRELVAVNGFEWDAKWIQSRLSRPISKVEIEKAMSFLVEHGFVAINSEGKASLPNKNLNCMGGVYQIALADYQRGMLGLAIESIDTVDREQRSLTGYTFGLSNKNLDAAKKILAEAQNKIAELEKNQNVADEVYHVGFSLFPLTKGGR